MSWSGHRSFGVLIAIAIAAVAALDAANVVGAARYRPPTWERTPQFVYVDALRPSRDVLTANADGLFQAGAQRPYAGGTVEASRAKPFELRGWAFDATRAEPFGAMLMSVDRAPFVPVAYQALRPDVARVTKCDACAKSGYAIAFEAGSLRTGPHALRFRFVTPAADGYVEWTPLTVIVR